MTCAWHKMSYAGATPRNTQLLYSISENIESEYLQLKFRLGPGLNLGPFTRQCNVSTVLIIRNLFSVLHQVCMETSHSMFRLSSVQSSDVPTRPSMLVFYKLCRVAKYSRVHRAESMSGTDEPRTDSGSEFQSFEPETENFL